MQRPAHQPGADDAIAGNRLLDLVVGAAGQTQPNRPFRAGVILPLDCAEPFDDCRWRVEIRLRDALVGKSALDDMQRGHGGYPLQAGEISGFSRVAYKDRLRPV